MRRLRRRTEDGAVAVMTALLTVVILGAAAIAIDIGTLAMERQKLHDAVDAAAHAGAYAMPGDGASAIAAARGIALSNDSDLAWDFTQQNPKIRLWCVVASNGLTPPAVQTSQIPSTCNPGPGAYTTANYPDLRCNGEICKIPCAPSPSTRCNTVEVVAEKDVPFGFANIFNQRKGSTGSVASAACKGSCGDETPNPLDVVVLADRTASLSNSDRNAMVNAVKSMMLTMDPTMHFLSIGTIDKSAPTSTCPSTSRARPPGKSVDSNYRVTPAWTAADLTNSAHKWMPTDFSRTYVSGVPGARVGTSTDPVFRTINCITSSSLGEYGTHLAAPLKEGARKLLNLSGSNLGTLSAAYPRPGDDDVTKVLILETDGAPNEFVNSGTSANWAVTGSTPGAELRNENGNTACTNLLKVAESAKAQDILVITIGFGEVVSAECDRWNNFGGKTGSTTGSSPKVRDVLAAAASPHPGTGAASTANSCSGSSAVAAENADGDFFFCAANGSELSDLFRTAISQVSKGVRLVKLPN